MFINDSRMPRGIGILPLRHNDYDKEYDLDFRAGIIAVAITGRNDAGEFGLGQWKYDADSAGDVTQAHFWQAAQGGGRPVGGWSWCWPATLTAGGASGSVPTPGGGGRPPVQTGGHFSEGSGGTSNAGSQGPSGPKGAAGGGAAGAGNQVYAGGPVGGGANAGPGVLKVGIGAGGGIGIGGGFAQFSFGGSSSLSSLTGIQGVGTGSGFAQFSFGGSSSLSSLTGIQGVGTGSGFAKFIFPPEPGSKAWYDALAEQKKQKGGANGAGNLGQAGPEGPQGPAGGPEQPPPLNQDVGGEGGGGNCQKFDSSSYKMLPCINDDYAPDARFQPLTPAVPLDSEGEPAWKPPVGSFGITLAATNEERQVNYFMPTDSRLYAVNHAGDHEMGTLVCDLGSDFKVDGKRTQHLQSAFRVVKEPLGGKNVIAFQLGLSGCKDTSGGWFYDRDIVARGSRTNGGPFDVGGKDDIHKIGVDADGHPINMLHIGTNALFRKNGFEDGPIRFEDEYKEGDDYTVPMKCHLAWTGFDWAIWSTLPMTPVPHPTPIPRPRRADPIKVGKLDPLTPTPTKGGTTGPGNKERPDVATPSNPRKISATLLNSVQEFVGAVTNFGLSGILAWPQNFAVGQENAAGVIKHSDGAVSKAVAERPVTGQMSAFAGQGGSVASGGSGPSTQVGGKGDPYLYTQEPGKSKFPCGTGPGGWCILPPEVSLADSSDGYVPPNITTSTTYFGVGPGAYFYAGLPELANGAVKSGYSWGVDTSTGDLVFRTHPVSTTPSNAVRFNSSGNVAWYSGTSYQGIFDHANTSDRTYTFPDESGTVALNLSVYKASDETVTNSTTLQDDDALTVSVSASTSYRFRFVIFQTSASGTAGLKLGINGTCTVTDMKAQVTIYDDTTNAIAGFGRITALGSSVGALVSTGDNYAVIEGTILVNAAGTLLLQWAQNVADAVNGTTVQKNSYCEIRRVP